MEFTWEIRGTWTSKEDGMIGQKIVITPEDIMETNEFGEMDVDSIDKIIADYISRIILEDED